MKVLDLFSCQGGAGVGYQRAGAEVTAVDLVRQPRNPLRFVQADAVEYVREHGHRFDFIHASPPRQYYSATSVLNDNKHPDLIGPTRDALNATGKPWVIENVAGAAAEMSADAVTLCGAMFGLHTYRHRLFEAGGWSFRAPEHPAHVQRTVKMGRPLKEGDFYHAVGNFTNVDYVRRDMGAMWMTREGLRECIPPAYSEFIGRAFLAHSKGAA